MLTDSLFSAMQLIALISVAFGGSSDTLESASAIMFLLPGRYLMSVSYCSSLSSSLWTLVLVLAIDFYHMLVRGSRSVSTFTLYPAVAFLLVAVLHLILVLKHCIL